MERLAEPQSRPRAIAERWPAGFLGMLALLAAAECVLAGRELRLAPMAAADWGLNRAEAAGEAASAEILCLGDSLIKCGVAPAVLAARLGHSAYNLAALGAATPASYFLLRCALDAGARPKAIVLDASASTLNAADYRGIVRNWAALLGPQRCAASSHATTGTSASSGSTLIHYLVPSVRMRLDLRKAIAGATRRPSRRGVGPDRRASARDQPRRVPSAAHTRQGRTRPVPGRRPAARRGRRVLSRGLDAIRDEPRLSPEDADPRPVARRSRFLPRPADPSRRPDGARGPRARRVVHGARAEDPREVCERHRRRRPPLRVRSRCIRRRAAPQPRGRGGPEHRPGERHRAAAE